MKAQKLFSILRSLRLGQAAVLGLGLFFARPAFAEGQDLKADGKGKDKEKAEAQMEAEANLPIYHIPLKAIRSNSVGGNRGETRLTFFRQVQTKPFPPGVGHSSLVTRRAQSGTSRPAELSALHSKILANLDSLARTQDKERQRALYGFKADEKKAPAPTQPALTELEKGSEPQAKPVLVSTPQVTTNKTPMVRENAAIWTRNDSVPHRGVGSSTLGGPANVRTAGISGTEVKIRP
jgi:hypothetical protein